MEDEWKKKVYGLYFARVGGWDNADFEAGVLCGSPAAECKDPEPAVWQLPHAAAPQTVWEDRRYKTAPGLLYTAHVRKLEHFKAFSNYKWLEFGECQSVWVAVAAKVVMIKLSQGCLKKSLYIMFTITRRSVLPQFNCPKCIHIFFIYIDNCILKV